MKQENKQFLDDNRRHYDTLMKAGFMSMDAHIKNQMQEVMRQEFDAGYHTTLWCSTCVVDMVKMLYRRYDEYLAKEASCAH